MDYNDISNNQIEIVDLDDVCGRCASNSDQLYTQGGYIRSCAKCLGEYSYYTYSKMPIFMNGDDTYYVYGEINSKQRILRITGLENSYINDDRIKEVFHTMGYNNINIFINDNMASLLDNYFNDLQRIKNELAIILNNDRQ